MDENLPSNQRIPVDEIVVYGTGVMESFASDFASILQKTVDRPSRWVVVFSPTGCDSMLKGLSMLDSKTGKVIGKPDSEKRTTYIATIGPTTRNYLKRTFDYEPEVCAEKPSPEGVWQGITEYMKRLT